MERVGDLDATEVDNVHIFRMNLFIGKKERDQFSMGIDGEELVVVFMKKRGATGDNRPKDFKPKNATFEQGCVGGREALGCRGDTVLGDESKDCLLGEDHC
jgi:hypothetical protein